MFKIQFFSRELSKLGDTFYPSLMKSYLGLLPCFSALALFTFWLDNSLLWAAVPCTLAVCLEAFLTSTHQMPGTFHPAVVTTKKLKNTGILSIKPGARPSFTALDRQTWSSLFSLPRLPFLVGRIGVLQQPQRIVEGIDQAGFVNPQMATALTVNHYSHIKNKLIFLTSQDKWQNQNLDMRQFYSKDFCYHTLQMDVYLGMTLGQWKVVCTTQTIYPRDVYVRGRNSALLSESII